ncbi:MAG: carbohydrate ABC transporter permease [Spirochaetaceae bacterium]|jgi:raffinose/stachyose/melibiose transport system permease protein|nr:carbohydrate ABC transporter permease [Spirochaetaceae bacterium]
MIATKRGVAEKTAFYLLAFFFFALFGFPFVLTVLMSFKSMQDYMTGNFWGFPKKLFLGNLQKILFSDFNIYIFNSIFVSGLSVALTTLIASLASYAFAKMKFRLSPVLFMLFVIGMMIPVHTTLIPIYQLTKALRLTDRLLGLIIPYISIGLPVGIYIMTAFFKDVPNSIQESAFIDGASSLRIYWNIMLPISVPAISTVTILNFLTYWNEFIYALTLINTNNKRTIPLGIKEFYGVEAVNIPAIFATILVASLPVIVFYILAQEKVINGLSAGAVKG